IGTNAAGNAAVGNANDGVLIANGVQNNTIGGATTASANLIAYNTAAGIAMTDANTTEIRIANDSIHDNSGGGINNSSGGVTVSSCTLIGNSAAAGGGIYNHAGTMTVSN